MVLSQEHKNHSDNIQKKDRFHNFTYKKRKSNISISYVNTQSKCHTLYLMELAIFK